MRAVHEVTAARAAGDVDNNSSSKAVAATHGTSSGGGDTRSERLIVARGLAARARMRERELPVMEQLALQRYARASNKGIVDVDKDDDQYNNNSADAKTATTRQLQRKMASMTTASSTAVAAAAAHPPLQPVRVPRALRNLLLSRLQQQQQQQHMPCVSPRVVELLTSDATHAAAAVAAAVYTSALPPMWCERVGVLFQRLAHVRTHYQDDELRKRIARHHHHNKGAGGNVNSSSNARALTRHASSDSVVTAGSAAAAATTAATTRTFHLLEDFDGGEGDVCTPEEWVARGAQRATVAGAAGAATSTVCGTLAYSRYHDGATSRTRWRACRVVDYDADTQCFHIVWLHDGDEEKKDNNTGGGADKWTRRLNIRFADEDVRVWRTRVQHALRYRRESEAAMREELYVRAIPHSAVPAADQAQLDRILGRVAARFRVEQLSLVREGVDAAEATYVLAMQRALYLYDCLDIAEQARLAACGLPPVATLARLRRRLLPSPSLRTLRATLRIVGYNDENSTTATAAGGGRTTTRVDALSPRFRATRTFLSDNLFQAHALLYDTLHTLHVTWMSYRERPLCLTHFDTHDERVPMQLGRFVELQATAGALAADKLRGEWCATVHSTLQNNLDAYVNFYEDDMERYCASRMCRFVRLVNVMMNTQVRELMVDSLLAYTAFMQRYRVADDDDDEEGGEQVIDELPEDAAERVHWEAREAALQAELQQQQQQQNGKGAHDRGHNSKAGESEDDDDSGHDDEDDDNDEHKPAPPQERFVWRLGVHENTVPYTRRVLHLTRTITGLQPLFAVKLVERHGTVCYQPPLEQVEAAVLAVFDACFTHTQNISGVGDQLFPLLELAPCVVRALDRHEPVVVEADARLRAVLRANATAPRQLQQMYATFDYLLQRRVDEVVDAAAHEQLPLHEYDLVFERLTRDVRRIAVRTPDSVKYALYAVNCQDMKATLTSRALQLRQALATALAQRLARECDEVIAEYEQLHARLAVEPTTPEELQALRGFVDTVAAHEARIHDVLARITAGHELLLRYEYTVGDEAYARYWLACEWPRRLRQFAERRAFRCKEYRAIFMQQLRDACEQLSFDLVQLAASVEDLAHVGDDARADELYETARGIEATMRRYADAAALYNRHEELFGLPLSQYPQLRELRTQFEPYLVLWEVASLFAAETDRWFNTRIAALQPVDVDTKITEWDRKLAVVAKKIRSGEPAEVLRRLRDSMDRFKPNIPLLYALRSNLQPAHWRAIYTLCGVPRDKQGFGPGGVDVNDTRALSEFVKLGLLEHMPQIESIASVAQKTYELESELMNMEGEWKKLLFEIEPYQDTYKLKANDTMQLTLDEHILKTQSMLGKPIVRQAPALQARVAQWGRQLDSIQCTMDEWFRCQNTWAYLEPIFASPDIAHSLPREKTLFVAVDEAWHATMEHTRTTPQVLTRCQDEALFRTLADANASLEQVLHKLQQFLETKRMAFPRFYFISNEELLQVLSDSKDAYLVQPYLCKCFEGIKRIVFGDHRDIVAMESAEGERVQLLRAVNPGDHGNQVELWLQALEQAMADTVRDQLRQATGDYVGRKRVEFIRVWPGQVVLAVCCYFWTMQATQAMLDEGVAGLSTYHEKCVSQLDELIVVVRDRHLDPVERCTLEALVVIEVHARDTVRQLCERGVDSPTSFDWLAQLRYYWQDDHLVVKQINAALQYGYEYLGNTGRLVITPLTDRCYRTLLGALHLSYGGAPEGPAGTGKTETTKDLAKALGKYCVVYNCSDQISAKDMAKLFKGLTQAGAWGCFDEFNRIEIQVLSVIAQQVATIQEAIVQSAREFVFDGALIRLDPGCAIFVTMNPGYAGRAELPDNLKALFRPVAMMVPNYAMIGEIQLYSYGFLHGKVLSEKIVATYRLCSEQLSSQDHYDYGMRAVKAVLTAAGRLKRQRPDEDEALLMLRSIQDVNLPKFLSQDVELFNGIVSDLFPGVTLPPSNYDDMQRAMRTVASRKGLQLTRYFAEKMLQTYEMICVRHGMMLVGGSYAGKTAGLHTLADALGELELERKEQRTRVVTLNPKAVTLPQLYGKVEASGEWTDGILCSRFRQLAQDTSSDRKWLVLDGPVDAVWIENMNTVLDDNKKLCLQNGDIIPMSRAMNLVFEVQDLAHASPATVSRCGMVYVEPDALGWRCLVDSYVTTTLPPCVARNAALLQAFRALVEAVVPAMLEFVRRHTQTIVPQGASTAVASLTRLFDALVRRHMATTAAAAATATTAAASTGTTADAYRRGGGSGDAGDGDKDDAARTAVARLEGWFVFALVWSLGGCLHSKDRQRFSATLHELLATLHTQHDGSGAPAYKFTLPLPDKALSWYDLCLADDSGSSSGGSDGSSVRFVDWMTQVPELVIAEGSEYQDIIVPTRETATNSFLVRLMIDHAHPVLLVGDTGTGKTILMKSLLKGLPRERYHVNMIQFSAQTSAAHLQRLIEGSCEKRRKGYYGPPINKQLLLFVDDANLPSLEEYGAQPPIELLRQYLDHGGWYHHSKDGIEFRHMVDALLLCAMGPAGGGRNPMTARFTRHFSAVSVPAFDEATLRTIFGQLADWILTRGFAANLRGSSAALVAATVELYTTLVDTLKPSPEKSHYTFNLRDVSKVFQGIDMAHAPAIVDERSLAELWVHEVTRAFSDRFTEDADTRWFDAQARQMCGKHFKLQLPHFLLQQQQQQQQDELDSFRAEGGSSSNVAATGATATAMRRASRLGDGDGDKERALLLFTTLESADGYYTRVRSVADARRTLEDKLDAYNAQSRSGELNLVVFDYVLEHVARISRVLKQPGGHLLLIGVGGSGRRSCARLAAFVQDCDYRTVTTAREYDHDCFCDDIRQLLLAAGQKGYPTAFVLSDTEIVAEAFLEDICSLLNTGEVPGLWDGNKQDKELYENAIASLRDIGKGLGRPDTAEALQSLFVERCRKHMHVVLCMSPLGGTLRERLRKFPSLVNCTTIDWFREWPEDGLRSVATRFLGDVDLADDERAAVREMFVRFQQQVRAWGADYLSEARQHTYVTPTSYLDLLSTFARLLKTKRSELSAQRQRYVSGLAQLRKTEDQVEVMQRELARMQPELAQKQRETDELIAQVEQESRLAEEQRALVAVDEAAANEQAAAAKRIKDVSQEKVDEAQPLVEQAQRAVQDLDPKALQEVKALKTPPQGVKYVIEVLCTLLGGVYKPKANRDPLTGKVTVPYWEHAKTTLLTGEFKNILLNAYSEIVDSAPEAQIEEVKRKMANDMFTMENIRKTSVALVGVATYIKAVVEYYKQNKVIKPLLAQAAVAQGEYDTAMAGLNAKKEELRIINEKLQALTAHLTRVNADKQELEDRVRDTDTKLTRARKLIEGLGGEKTRFAKEAERAADELQYVTGHVVVSAGVVAYMGPFMRKYRKNAVAAWTAMCRAEGICVHDNFSFTHFCGNALDIQTWKLQQLPSDDFSVQNAVILRNSSRWPLLVDPQQQANNWIRNMERDNELVVVRPSEADYMRTLRAAITDGKPLLLENVDEVIDPMLENLLLKRLTREGTMWTMQLGGEPVEWNGQFRFYMTTKLPRPHYLPEVSTKVTLINFTLTEVGLQDQLLQRVMMTERRDVEEKKQALTFEAAANRAGLQTTEDRILAILSAEGNILEREDAIEELDNAKEQSDRIAKRQEEIEAMERISDRTRNLFVPVAHLGAILFFCVTELSNIDPMYQNSLQAYVAIFQEALVNSERASEVEQRIANITAAFKTALYQRICRSLFARDQLLFSFIMALKMYEVDATLLRWLLMGGFDADTSSSSNNGGGGGDTTRTSAAHGGCPFEWLPLPNWRMLHRASVQLPCMKGILDIVDAHSMFFRDYYESSHPLDLELPPPLHALTSFEKLVLVRCFRTDKIVPAVTNYVREVLGDAFVTPPLYALEAVVDELAYDPAVPIILVLSPGADPNAELARVAEAKGMLQSSRLFKLSLGQGQDAPARELIRVGTAQGHWVLLQNCHLYADFMPALARLIEDYGDFAVKDKLHSDYRLWLTSLPSEAFPISILQNGVKLVQEPPKGLKSNLLQSYLTDPVADAAFFDSSNKPEVWRKMLFGLCFFHAVVQERRRYGPLGWNRPYEFNDTDRRISVRQLNMLLNENEAVPYDALLYLIGQCNYGGRVTDDWDRRCLMATLQVYLTPFILEDDYVFSDDALEYYAPAFGDYASYLDYIHELPQQQPPSIFGLHENADIAKDERDARVLLEATLTTQPRDAVGATSSACASVSPTTTAAATRSTAPKLDPKTTVRQLAADVVARLPDAFDIEDMSRRYPINYAQSMNTVLVQEAIRYNRLLAVVRRSLVDVQDALSGKVVMSAELERVFNSMYDGKVPDVWKRYSYPSLKPLGAYVNDLIARLRFLRAWCDEGPPVLFWISGFFFTQSFLTGVMQNYARKHRIEIDKLVWRFVVMPDNDDDDDGASDDDANGKATRPREDEQHSGGRGRGGRGVYATPPEEGCYIYGLYLEGAGWRNGVLCDSKPKELFVNFPVIRLTPARPEEIAPAPTYSCPCYKTTDRKGVLSTTGHSTNFIIAIDLPRDPADSENKWVLCGAALFTQLDF